MISPASLLINRVAVRLRQFAFRILNPNNAPQMITGIAPAARERLFLQSQKIIRYRLIAGQYPFAVQLFLQILLIR